MTEVLTGIPTHLPGLTTGERWSENPEQIQLDISATAAGESNVLIQWQWTGNWEYNWNLDDVFIYDADPRPANDMRVNNFRAVAPNFATPASQVTPFGFIADIQNLGSQTQENATLTVSISDAGGEVFSDELVYASIGADSVAENVFFEEEFVPDMMPGAYTGQYELTLGEADANPEDNVRPFSFIVTDTLFQRDSGEGLGGTRPADDNDFSYGNVYYVTNGENLFARYVTFGVSNSTKWLVLLFPHYFTSGQATLMVMEGCRMSSMGLSHSTATLSRVKRQVLW